ncbi:MAG TPA: lipocalin-like domain-containing protein [Acidobacteriaceae bacterium]|nr:lipocalin-like domain-containing protein [Acidobacteriaceae bacterium]
MTAQATAADFIGTWRLLDYSFIHEDGAIEHPWGTHVRGYLLYSAEGYMSGNLSPAKDWPSRRARLTAALKSHDGAGALRLARPASRREYIAYTGRYTVEGDTITHHVEASLFPNWVGRSELRHYKFEGDTLTLRTGPVRSGIHTITAQLVWERVQ